MSCVECHWYELWLMSLIWVVLSVIDMSNDNIVIWISAKVI